MRKIFNVFVICIIFLSCIVLLNDVKIYAGNKYIEVNKICKEYKIKGKTKVYLVEEEDTYDMFFCKKNKNGKYVKLTNHKVWRLEKKVGDRIYFETEKNYLASVDLNKRKVYVFKVTKNYDYLYGVFGKKIFFSKHNKIFSITERGKKLKKVHNSDYATVIKNGIYYTREYLIIDEKKIYIEGFNDLSFYRDKNIEDYRWTVYRKDLDGNNKEVILDSKAFEGDRYIAGNNCIYISKANNDNTIELYYMNLNTKQIELKPLLETMANDVAYKSYDNIDEIESPIYFLEMKNKNLYVQIGRYIYKIKPNGDTQKVLKLRKKNNYVVSFKITKNYYKIEYSTYTLDGPEYSSEDVIYYYDKKGNYKRKKKIKREHIIE